jgi:AcrR family transcriptional regulator
MGQRAEQKAQTRQRLLAVAREVFEAQGFEAASLRQIAQQAEIAPGTIFVHFQDKYDLLHAALFEDLERTLDAALALPAGQSLAHWLSQLTNQLFAYYEARPTLSRVLLRESLLAEPPWGERFTAQFARVHAVIVVRAETEIPDPAERALFAVAYLSFYLFGLLAWAQKTHPAPHQLVAHLTEQHLRGLQS